MIPFNYYFVYDNGILRRAVSNNTKHKVGEIVGYKSGRYRRLKIHNKSYMIHRVIWEMFNGVIPTGMEVDHIDRNPTNNKIANLRLATPSENSRNYSAKSNSKTGVRGVYHNGHSYVVTICGENGREYIGSFPTLEEATKIRRIYERTYKYTV